jgi:hypothetical protein
MEQKEIAIQCLERLDIYKPYVRKFKSKAGIPCFFENFGGYYVDQEPEIWNKVKEVEKENGGLVYAITHERTNIGETWSMLYVPRDCDAVEDVLDPISSREFYVFAYVWNKSDDILSEFGDIVVYSFGGGIKRIG